MIPRQMENKKEYKASAVDSIDGDIIVVTGDIQRVKFCSDLSLMDFNTVRYNKNACNPERGLIDKPEGFTCEGDISMSNDPFTLICNIEEIIMNGFKGIILTNSHFVVDAVHVYSKMYSKTARFFIAEWLMVEGCKLFEHTKDLNKVYKRFAVAVDKLNDDRYRAFGEEA